MRKHEIKDINANFKAYNKQNNHLKYSNYAIKTFVFLLIKCIASTTSVFVAQNTINGYVYSISEDDKAIPIPGVHIKILNKNIGTISNKEGGFYLDIKDTEEVKIIFSFIGFKTDTLEYTQTTDTLRVVMKEGNILKDVDVIYDRGGYYISKATPINTHTIGQSELRKAACCSLSESFETNPSVDASYTDAITGTKQIKMLGLSGKYVQIMQDNIPSVRGLTTIYGLDYIPGAWINSIQVSKGVGSVTNGFESITGQINLDMKKPINAERFHLNMYGNIQGRLETNIYTNYSIKKSWKSTLLVHVKNQTLELDNNNDYFLDHPTSKHIIAKKDWKYTRNNIRMSYGIGGVSKNSRSGTLENQNIIPSYNVKSKTQQINSYAKLGILFPENDYKNIGIQLSGNYYNYDGSFSYKNYKGKQYSGYLNIIFQDEITSNHKYKVGVNSNYDNYDETINLDTIKTLNYKLTEKTIGGYIEHNFKKNRINLISGLRGDYNNNYGAFITTRINGSYSFSETSTLKIALGNGTRTPNIIMENIGSLASARKWNIYSLTKMPRYGLKQEKAWNFGLGYNKEFEINNKKGNIQLDLYRTEFTQQVVVDLDKSSQEINIYNLNGRSFANSFQAELNYEINKRVDLRLAYRFLDVKVEYNSIGLKSMPFVATNRAFISLSYESKENNKGSFWKGDITSQWIGKQRIPSTIENPSMYQLDSYSPDYIIVNSQITRVFNKAFEVYLGGENLTNYRQKKPILQSNNPNGNYFDSSLIWGPIMGVNIYLGLRWTID